MARDPSSASGRTRAGAIAVVVGAAHAAAFAAGDVDPSLEAPLPAACAVPLTLIPSAFRGSRSRSAMARATGRRSTTSARTTRAATSGAPRLRSRGVHRAPGLRGFMASLADTIEAYRLAVTLADIRGKAEPGLDEVREATIATMCRGMRGTSTVSCGRPSSGAMSGGSPIGSARTRSRRSSGARCARGSCRRRTRRSRSR